MKTSLSFPIARNAHLKNAQTRVLRSFLPPSFCSRKLWVIQSLLEHNNSIEQYWVITFSLSLSLHKWSRKFEWCNDSNKCSFIGVSLSNNNNDETTTTKQSFRSIERTYWNAHFSQLLNFASLFHDWISSCLAWLVWQSCIKKQSCDS